MVTTAVTVKATTAAAIAAAESVLQKEKALTENGQGFFVPICFTIRIKSTDYFTP